MKKVYLLLFFALLSATTAFSQAPADSIAKPVQTTQPSQQAHSSKGKIPDFFYKNGIGFSTPDSSYSINIRFRIQSRFLMNTLSDEDLSPASWEARVRRCRLSFTGHVYNSKWSYYLQLSFSKGDMDWDMNDASTVNNSPNVVRDAMIFYKPFKILQLGLGQGKLPGNRQRVVSSGSLQFHDRSIVNSNFTFDRDFGFFVNLTPKIGKSFRINLKTAVTSGEGRNSASSNAGLAYTGRLELLPFGDFTDGGDYFEGDVAREEKIKMSIAGSYHFNDLAVRTQGQLGKDLYAPKSFHGYEADILIKFKGLAVSAEYIRRDADNPITKNTAGSSRNLVTGDGINSQLSYCFKNRIEIALRHSLVTPHNDLFGKMNEQEQYGMCLTKYLMKHKVKLQAFAFYSRERDMKLNKDGKKNFYGGLQLELGI